MSAGVAWDRIPVTAFCTDLQTAGRQTTPMKQRFCALKTRLVTACRGSGNDRSTAAKEEALTNSSNVRGGKKAGFPKLSYYFT